MSLILAGRCGGQRDGYQKGGCNRKVRNRQREGMDSKRFVGEYQKEGSCGFPSIFIGVLTVRITK
jgi:hypothetical protein